MIDDLRYINRRRAKAANFGAIVFCTLLLIAAWYLIATSPQ